MADKGRSCTSSGSSKTNADVYHIGCPDQRLWNWRKLLLDILMSSFIYRGLVKGSQFPELLFYYDLPGHRWFHF